MLDVWATSQLILMCKNKEFQTPTHIPDCWGLVAEQGGGSGGGLGLEVDCYPRIRLPVGSLSLGLDRGGLNAGHGRGDDMTSMAREV